jgi:hypothetical protein
MKNLIKLFLNFSIIVIIERAEKNVRRNEGEIMFKGLISNKIIAENRSKFKESASL